MKLQITLSEYIQQVGYQTVTKMTGASESTVKAWRYFNRVPRVKQAKKLIVHSHGLLSWESIYGLAEDTETDRAFYTDNVRKFEKG